MVTRIAARICMMALFVTAFAAGPTLAQADDANKILKTMSGYLARFIQQWFETAVLQRVESAVLGGVDGRGGRGLRLRREGSIWGSGPVGYGGSLAIRPASMAKPAW